LRAADLSAMPASVRLLVAVLAAIALAACGADDPVPTPAAGAPGVALTAQEREVWRPLPTTAKGIPVLLYHGIGEPDDFENPADAAYGIRERDFAKQVALLRAAGHEAITLEQFRAYHAGEPVDLPPRPVLITFDDGLDSSFDGADAVLREHGWTAVMFVDVGAVDARLPGYASWQRLATAQRSGVWDLQLHAGHGHHNIDYGPERVGPYYAYRVQGHERLGDWWDRVRTDLEWGERELRAHVPGYRPLAFAPPYGNYGQVSTNDPRIPERLGAWLQARYGLVFTQDPATYAAPGAAPAPRLQITRAMTGGGLRAWLAEQLPR
jgi:peptidoglycan/xylan/chitin deacetylase (PgdA/CDA1 family)